MKLGNISVNAGAVRSMISKVMVDYRAECERAAPHVLKLEKRLSDQLEAMCQPPLSDEEQVVEHIRNKRFSREKKQEKEVRMVKDWTKGRGLRPE